MGDGDMQEKNEMGLTRRRERRRATGRKRILE
jgi:hypothetical protein